MASPLVNVLTFTPGDPTAQTSATYVMMGLGSTVSITPQFSGRVLVLVSGVMGNTGAAGNGTTIQLSFGTGAAPANNAAVTGTQVGPQIAFIASTTAGQQGFCIAWTITGLTVPVINGLGVAGAGTAVWIDLALKTVTGGPGLVKTTGFALIEV